MSLVVTTIEDGIGTIAMNRPEKRNALSTELVAALKEAFQQFKTNDNVRVVILKGNGKAFCAGADLAYLQEIAKNSALENVADSTSLMEFMQSIVEFPKPVSCYGARSSHCRWMRLSNGLRHRDRRGG